MSKWFARKEKDGTVIGQEGGKPVTPEGHHSKVIVNPDKNQMEFMAGDGNIYDIHTGKIVRTEKKKK